MSIEAIARGGSKFRTFVEGVQKSSHTQVHKAIQRASELIEAGAQVVNIDHDYRLEVFDSAVTTGVSEDESLADDLTAIAAAGKSLDGKQTRLYIRGMTEAQQIQYALDYAMENSRGKILGTRVLVNRGSKTTWIGFAWRGSITRWDRATFRIRLENPQ